jgi:Ca-activated chloride channel family protein
MDDRQLKDLLGDIPAADENARKRAVNLALAEFEAAKNDSKKTFQGFSFLSRLMGRSNEDPRREKVNKKLIYSGMATAMAVVLAVGVTLNKPASDISALQAPTAVSNYSSLAKNKNSVEMAIAPERRMAESADRAVAMPSPAEKPVQPPMAQDYDLRRGAEMMQSDALASVPAATAAMNGEAIPQSYYHESGHDKFESFEESPIKEVVQEPVSTFSIDVDTSSYSFIRKQLNAGVLPQKDAVRVEEMVNYFDYDYPLPENKAEPFRPAVTVTPSPWNEGRKLIHIGIKGYDIPATAKPRSNLVFLLDTSGSMDAPDKLPLLKNSLKMLLDTLSPEDTVGIVTYAGSAGVVLEPTRVSEKSKIIAVIDGLGAGGGTAGAEGIRTAYQLIERTLNENIAVEKANSPTHDGPVPPKTVNRVILATDGDFNVGITNPEELKDFVERERGKGIFLSVLGFGQGNYNDQMMQVLAQNGNGVAAYIDTLNEARKVLVEEAGSTLFTIAKDVKIQVDFNPATVAEYRLVGYETRHLNREDFNNDAVDAGDIGSGHAVTAIYEITPAGGPRTVDASRYEEAQNCKTMRVHATDDPNSPLMKKEVCGPVQEQKANTNFADEYAFLKIRYKLPDGDTSKLMTTPITVADEKALASTRCPVNARCLVADTFGASDDVRFSVAVAGFGQLLKGGKNTGHLTYDDVIALAQGAKGEDEFGYRAEFINLVRLAKSAQGLPATP